MKIRTTLVVLGMSGVASAQDFLQTDPPSFGGVLFPHFHANAVVGDATRDPADLASHGHDPNDQFTLQGLELGLSLRAGEYLEGFVNHNFFIDLNDDWDSEWEEAFLKLVNLPGGFEVRAGRLFNRVSRQNPVHLHGWDFVDANLITTRFLGDEGLVTNSVELTWNVPTPFESALSVSFGEAVPHDHEHSHGHDDDHDDDHGDDDDHDDDHDEEGLEGEEGLFDTEIVTVRYDALWNYNDFHQFRFGGSFLIGDNSFMRTTTAAGLDVEYVWRENGLEAGGRSVRWLTEVMGRDVEYQDEMGGGKGSADEWGLASSVVVGFAEDWSVGFRYGWVSGIDELEELPERHRISAAITKRCQWANTAGGWTRLQVSHEDHEEFGDEQSVWLQFGFDWGGPEVR